MAFSLVRGLGIVGRSAVVLAVVFVAALILWLVYSSSGVVHFASPGVLAQIEALPPIQSLLDIEFLRTASRALPLVAVVGIGVLVVLVRAAVTAFVVGFATSAMTGGEDERASARTAAAGIPRVLFPLVSLEIAFMALVFVLSQILATALGPIGLLASLVVPMYLLVYAPAVVVTERVPFAEAVRLGIRATRVPGRYHVLLTVTYAFLSVFLLAATSGGPAVPVTPSIAVWAYALLLTFLHTAVLAAFTYRWLVIRPAVLKGGPRPVRMRWTLAPRSAS